MLARAAAQAREAEIALENAADHKARMLAKRKCRQHQVLAGFPVLEPFRSLAQAKDYLDCPELTCLLCGKSYRLLANHLRSTHGVDPDEYRLAYDMPLTPGLSGRSVAEKKSVALRAKLADPEFRTKWFADVENHRMKARERARHQRTPAFRLELAKQHLEKAGTIIGRWRDDDFLRILDVMRAHDLILKEAAGQFDGLPPYDTARKWFRSHPGRQAKLVATLHQLSYRNQARSRCFGPQLSKHLRELRNMGMLQREIAEVTGLSVMTVAKLLGNDLGQLPSRNTARPTDATTKAHRTD